MTTWSRRADSATRIALTVSICAFLQLGAFSSRCLAAKPEHTPVLTEPKPAASPTPSAGKYSVTSPIEDAALNPQLFIPPAKDLSLEPGGTAKADALARFVEGLSLEEAGEPAKAQEAFTKSLQLDPTNIPLATRLALTLARKGEVTEAIGVLKDCIKAAPEEPGPQLALAYFYLRYLKKPDAAEPYALKALALDPNEPRTYAYLVEIYLVRGQDKKAEAILEKALEAKSKQAEFWVALGELYRRILIPEDQTPSPQVIKKVARFFEKAAQIESGNPAVLNQLANFYSLTHQLNKAIPLYLKVLELSPANEELLNAVRENLALSYFQNKEHGKAVEVLEAVVKDEPQRRFAYELLGDIYEKMEDYKNALRAYEKCLELSPGSSIQYNRVVRLLLGELKDSKRALEVLEQARSKFPDIPDFTFWQAIAFRFEKRLPESLATFKEAEKECESHTPNIAMGGFYFEYGVSAEMSKDFNLAATLFKKSIELDPTNPAAYNYLGYMWVDRNENLEEAGELIKRAVEMKPTEPAYLDSLGWYYYRIGNYQRAIGELIRACETLPEPDPIVLDHVADTYLKLGDDKEAISFWERALKLDPENKAIAEKIETAKKKGPEQ